MGSLGLQKHHCLESNVVYFMQRILAEATMSIAEPMVIASACVPYFLGKVWHHPVTASLKEWSVDTGSSSSSSLSSSSSSVVDSWPSCAKKSMQSVNANRKSPLILRYSLGTFGWCVAQCTLKKQSTAELWTLWETKVFIGVSRGVLRVLEHPPHANDN